MIKFSEIKNINHLWGVLIIEELRRCGVDYFCIAPGSRSAPLVFGVSQNHQVISRVHYDERGLAYHALGYASATGKPACIIVTSGTAVGNCFPAVIEASKKKVPLIVLTADRPPQLRNTGANQTIDQVKIFGDYARFYFDMPVPSAQIPLEMVLTTVDQAVYRSRSGVPGPVHINCMFNKPLVPIKDTVNLKPIFETIGVWSKASSPLTSYISPIKELAKDSLLEIVSQINEIKNGIIVVGKLKTQDERKNVLMLSQKLNWPIFPDITSGLRLERGNNQIINYFDQVLLGAQAQKKYAPDGVLHLGGRLTSDRFYNFIAKIKPARYIMVLDHPLRNDPLHLVTLRVESGVSRFCKSIYGKINPRKNDNYCLGLRKISEAVGKKIGAAILEDLAITPVSLIQNICRCTQVRAGLFLSSSMSIRIMDAYASENKNIFAIGSNRGASGIDGVIATAAGFASGIDAPCVLLLGDLAFLHDLNSLNLIKEIKKPFVIIVLNDDGGGIFSFLPVVNFPKVCEKYFSAPHGLNFELAARMFGIAYLRPKTNADFIENYSQALNGPGATIIEVSLSRQDNLKTIRFLEDQVRRMLEKS